MRKYTDKEIKKIIHEVVKNDKEEVLRSCDNYEEAVSRPDELTEKMLFAIINSIFNDNSEQSS